MKATVSRKPMRVAGLIVVCTMLFVLTVVLFKPGGTLVSGETIQGSRFSVYENRVYVLVPGSRRFVLPDADAATSKG